MIKKHATTLLLILAIVRGLVYAFALPPWGILDEEQHFDYIVKIAQTGRPPIVGQDKLDPAIIQSVIETDRHQKFHWPIPSAEYWNTSLEQESYEGYQPPLFYYLFTVFYLVLPDDILSQLFVLRIIVILLSAISVWSAVRLTQMLVPEKPQLGYWVGFLIICLPERAYSLARLSNDSLLELISILMLWIGTSILLKGLSWKKSMLLGFIAGLGILTKVSFAGLLAFIPFILWQNRNEKHVITKMLVAGLIFLAFCAPFVLYNLNIYGDITGFQGFEKLFQGSGTSWMPAYNLTGLLHAAWDIFTGFWLIWWQSEIAVVTPLLRVFYGALLLATIFAAYGFLKAWRKENLLKESPRKIVFLAYVAVIGAYVLITLKGYFDGMYPVIQGRFFVPALFPIAFLFCYGLLSLEKSKPILGVVCAALLVADALFLFAYFIPYVYFDSATIEGQPTSGVWQGWRWAFRLLFMNFSGDKPGWVLWVWISSAFLYLSFLSIPFVNLGRNSRQLFSILKQGVEKKLRDPLVWISLAAFLLFFSLAIIKPKMIFWSLDEGGKWIYMESVLRNRDPATPLIYPGKYLDSNYENIALYFFARKGDEIYSWWQVGFPLLTIPFYKLLGWYGLYFLPAFGGAVVTYLSGRITQALKGELRIGYWVAGLIAISSPIMFYSATFWEHTLSVACILGVVYLVLLNIDSSNHRSFIAAGVLGSLAIFFRTEAALIIGGFGLVLIFVRWRNALWMMLGGGAVSLVWGAINQTFMGNPLSPNAGAVVEAANFNTLLSTGPKFFSYALFNAPLIGAYSLGNGVLVFGSMCLLLFIILSIFLKSRWWSLPFLAGVIFVCAYVLLQPDYYRSVHGFVLIAPFVLFATWIFKTEYWQKHKTFWAMVIGSMIVFAVGYTIRGWLAAGGLQWGPRYMLAFYPIMMIAGILAVQDFIGRCQGWRRFLISAVALIALLVGAGYQVRGYHTMLLTMRLYNESAHVLRTMKDEVIFTECTWMPMVIPDLYWNGNVFRGEPSETMMRNLGLIGKNEYVEVEMLSCNTTALEKVQSNYKSNLGGLIVRQRQVNNNH